MKQNPPQAKFFISPVLMLAVCLGGCAIQSRQARHTPSRTPSAQLQTSLEASQINRIALLNINTATAQELEALPGVGKATAERIVLHRQQYGPFRRVEHLMMVRGISDRKFRAIQQRLAATDGR